MRRRVTLRMRAHADQTGADREAARNFGVRAPTAAEVDRACHVLLRTPSRPRHTRPKRSCSSPPSARRASRSVSSISSRSPSSSRSCSPSSSRLYRQTIFAYPSGGGAYIVSRENLGETPSLVAGASLLVDYILTVAVSISAGVAAMISIPTFADLESCVCRSCLFFVAAPHVANLRGMKESGRVFAAPTYIYIVAITAMVAIGLWRVFFGDVAPVPFDAARAQECHRARRRIADPVPAAARVLVGRRCALRCRGHLQWRPSVPPPGVEERGDDAHADGVHPRHALPRVSILASTSTRSRLMRRR